MFNIKIKNSKTELPKEAKVKMRTKFSSPTEIENSRGISVLFVVLIMGMMLAISLGVSSILMQQTESLRNIGYSVIAFYAADTGVENVLDQEDPLILHGYEETLENGAQYSLTVRQGGSGNCPGDKNYCIRSVGTYKTIKRGIEINY